MNSESTNPVALAIREFYLANLGQFSNARQCALYLGANGIVVPGIGKAFFSSRTAEIYLVGIRAKAEEMRRNINKSINQ